MAKLGGKLKEIIRQRKWKIKIKTWVLLVLLIPLLVADATLMRLNHIKMTELRDAVLAVDAKISEDESDEEMQATDEELKEALVNLKEFMFSHIVINVVEENGIQRITFGTGPFYLEHQYLRAATKALNEAEKNMASDSNPNGNIYAMASAVCQPIAIANGWRWNSAGYINCMMGEIQKYPASDEIQDRALSEELCFAGLGADTPRVFASFDWDCDRCNFYSDDYLGNLKNFTIICIKPLDIFFSGS